MPDGTRQAQWTMGRVPNETGVTLCPDILEDDVQWETESR